MDVIKNVFRSDQKNKEFSLKVQNNKNTYIIKIINEINKI